MKKIVCKIICIFALTSLLTLQINAEDDLANQPATCDDMTCLTGGYIVKSISSAYTTYGPKLKGTSGNSSTLNLNISFETSNSYTGSLQITSKALSAKVGYTIGKKYTVTASGSKNNPNHYTYTGYYREIRSTKKVIQDKKYTYGVCKGWANINKAVYPYTVTGAEIIWTRTK